MLSAARVVTSSAVHAPGWVSFEEGRITGVGSGAPVSPPTRDLGDVTLVPGFVDVHVHGGGGAGYAEGSAALALRARDAHLAHGTTTSVASLVTDTSERLLESVRLLAGLVETGELRGIHLEGPWLSPARAGAHDPGLLRNPDPDEIDALLAAGALPGPGANGAGSGSAPANAIAAVTIAPELPGAIGAIERFARAGVVVAVGHTDADYDCVVRAIEAGATVATHLFNAMRPLHHREPGPVLALLEDPRVSIELIADGTHLHPRLARWAAARAGEDRALLVTDAMGAAACGDGAYRLGALDVEVARGVARLAGTETIAGSTATMDGLFRHWVAGAAASADPESPDAADEPRSTAARAPSATEAALLAAVRLTAVNPARALRWSDVGDLAVGKRMDAVVLDPDLRVVEVIRAAERT
ncbi:amidohydrolase family protein [Leucobacter tenebrionis]|nr:amidohydrolase family protein [Leucobacter tenebrionis]